MKKIYILLTILLLSISSCDDPVVEKPEKLIPKEKMIEMLTDIHIAEATYNIRKNQDSLLHNSNSADFYYSILKKYNEPDTIFEKSYIYYASNPKNFEKMYRQVMNNLNEMEQEFSRRKNEKLDLEIREKQQ
jgi:site-specific DNA-adenine methylase